MLANPNSIFFEIAFITGNSSLEPLVEGLFAQIHVNLSWRVFDRNRTWDLRRIRFLKCHAFHHWARVTDESSKIPLDSLFFFCICVLFHSSFVCIELRAKLLIYFLRSNKSNIYQSMSAYANVYFKTTCECLRQINIHRSEVHCGSAFEPGGSGLPYYCTPPVCVPDVFGALAVWRLLKNKKLM